MQNLKSDLYKSCVTNSKINSILKKNLVVFKLAFTGLPQGQKKQKKRQIQEKIGTLKKCQEKSESLTKLEKQFTFFCLNLHFFLFFKALKWQKFNKNFVKIRTNLQNSPRNLQNYLNTNAFFYKLVKYPL